MTLPRNVARRRHLPLNSASKERWGFEWIVDLSQELAEGMPVYPGNPIPRFRSFATIARDGANLTLLSLGSHTGTHVDAPRHFVSDGIAVDMIAPSRLIGEALVIDLSDVSPGAGVTARDLSSRLCRVEPDDFVLFYTGCSQHWGEERYTTDYTYLTEGAAELLASMKVRAVGIDCLSIERFGSRHAPAHRKLLGRGIFIIESLSSALRQFVGGRIFLVCLPLKLSGGDAAPARAIAAPIPCFQGTGFTRR